MSKKFVVIDYDPSVIDELEVNKIHHIYGDVTDVELLDEVGIETAKLVVSTITEHTTNLFLVSHIHAINDQAAIVCHSDSAEESVELYEHGASYVVMTHAIGSEKLGSFIKRNGLKKNEFKKHREKHVNSLIAKIGEMDKTAKAEEKNSK